MSDKLTFSVSSDPNTRIMTLGMRGLNVVAAQDQSTTAFVGVASNNVFLDIFPTKTVVELLIKGFNNRTRERNYYQLYSSLLEGRISEDDFDDEIDSKPDKYVIPMNTIPMPEVMSAAIRLTPSLMDIETAGDFEAAFSFQQGQAEEFCKIYDNERILPDQ